MGNFIPCHGFNYNVVKIKDLYKTHVMKIKLTAMMITTPRAIRIKFDLSRANFSFISVFV